MFCDLAGSTALGEKLDPEELRSLLHAYWNLCGDVIARYFGWPTAHEEDAERAVRAAMPSRPRRCSHSALATALAALSRRPSPMPCGRSIFLRSHLHMSTLQFSK